MAEVAELRIREELKRASAGLDGNLDLPRFKNVRSPPRESSKRRKDWHCLILLWIILTQVHSCTSKTKLF